MRVSGLFNSKAKESLENVFINYLRNTYSLVSYISYDCRLENSKEIKRLLISKLGSKYIVKTRLEQNAFLYKLLNSEKLIVFIILVFILIIASFRSEV